MPIYPPIPTTTPSARTVTPPIPPVTTAGPPTVPTTPLLALPAIDVTRCEAAAPTAAPEAKASESTLAVVVQEVPGSNPGGRPKHSNSC